MNPYRYMWELAEKQKDGSIKCVHGESVEYRDGATRHPDGKPCVGTGTGVDK